jgi:tRNA A37 threonylcarbamoyladenosine synthetase subunit TsaC/SUA5/YrdC
MQAVVLSLRSENLGECAAKVALSLKRGNLCIVPTDTIYGIVALDRLPDAVQRVYAIKKRPMEKPLIRLIGRAESLRDFTDQALPPSLAAYWPGPLTIVFRGKRRGAGEKSGNLAGPRDRGDLAGSETGDDLAGGETGADRAGGETGGDLARTEACLKIAVRFPDDPFLHRLFEELKYSPLVAPSANISGEEDIFDCSTLARIFSNAVDIILCRENWSGGKKPSTILDIAAKPWKILREGAVKVDPALLR